jgi:uncharacterized protein (TIGR02646 family)
MKPVCRGDAPREFSQHGDAKPYLLMRLGLHCVYCEQAGAPQSLQVEHIYSQNAHEELVLQWENFLVSCATCNTYKRQHLGDARQVDLEERFLWPHVDNTFRAFKYFDDGRIEMEVSVSPDVIPLARGTMEMAGLMKSPAVASEYDISIAYSIISKRKEMWEIAEMSRQEFVDAHGAISPASIAQKANRMGHFSIWMAVFRDHVDVRREMIAQFKADPGCFDNQTRPVAKGRI